MLSTDKKDENTQTKLAQVLAWGTEAFPNSEKLWQSRLSYVLTTNDEELATQIFTQVMKKKLMSILIMKVINYITEIGNFI